MKLFFLKDHSLYKIFKTLEKIPNGKTIHIYIDPEHAFFDNEWWGKQIQELLVQKNLHAFFVTKTEKARKFFEKIWLQVIHQEQYKILKALHLAYLFFFNIKRFHLQVYTKKNYIFYIVFWFEVAFVLIILYFLYSLILPRTIIQINPSNQTEDIIYNFRYYAATKLDYPQNTRNLSIPFQTGFIDYKYTMSISVDNIKHIQNPSQWDIKIVNTTNQSFPLLKGTRFETNDGLVFKSKNWFNIPAKWEVFVKIVANDQDNQGILIGARGNITKWTKLYIKNLKESYFLKNIYAVATEQFSWGTLISEWVVSPKDISVLSGKLITTLQQQKMNIIDKNFTLAGKIFLRFDNMVSVSIQSVSIENQPKQKVPYLKWAVVARLSFAYINEADLFSQIEKYIAQRPTDKVKLINIDKSSLVFYSTIKQDTLGAYIIPTKVSIIQGYDFQKDINGIVDTIKTNIVGKDKEKAKEFLFGYPEISSAKIIIRPPRYSTITRLKSRISIEVK